MSRVLLVAGLTAFFFTKTTAATVNGSSDKWEVVNIRDSIVTFRNGIKLNTDLYDVEYVGRLSYSKASPLLIFSGRDCHDCDARKAIFIFSPGNKEKKIIPEYAPFDYPGSEYSTDSTLLYESRMFIGNVLPNVPNGIIWYQTMLNDYGVYESSIYLIRVENGKIFESMELENLPSINDSLKLAAEKKCAEIKREDFISDEDAY